MPGGLRLHLAPSSKFKTASVKVFIRTDLAAETATEVALLPYVLRHGTRGLPSMRQITRRREELYGTQLGVDVLKLGEQQVLSFSLGLLGDAFLPDGEGVFEPSLRLLADLLFDPCLLDGEGFRPEAVGQEAEKLRKFIEGLKNDKATYAAEACVRTMCGGEPYAVFEYGALEDVDRVSATSLEARRRKLLQTAPIDIYVAGAFDPAQARTLIDELFRLESRPSTLPALRGTSPHPARGEVREVCEPMQVKQGKLCMGFRSEVRLEDPAYWDLFVMNGILGGFPHSKLFKNVREKEGLCYDASSSFERFKGLLFISAGIEGESFPKARDLCLEQLAAIRRGEIEELELEATRMSYFQAFRGLLDNPSSLINLDYSMSLGGRRGVPADAIAGVEAVTLKGVQAAAERVFLDTIYFLEPQEVA